MTAPASTGAPGAAAVTSADPRAAAAGAEMLRRGGNAADAATAVMVALTVVEPQSSGIGGGGFMLYQDAAAGELFTIDGREAAPAGATQTMFLDGSGKPMPFLSAVEGGTSVGVPGVLQLAATLHRRFGKLPWSALFEPAIKLAEDGYAVTPRLNQFATMRAGMLNRSEEGRALYLQADGTAKPVGTIIRNPALARILKELAARGSQHFYTGSAGTRLVRTVRGAANHPSTMSEADLASYRAVERTPVCGQYRVWRVCGMGPPSSGGTTVFGILKALEPFDLPRLGPDNITSWHLMAEAMRLAYADRNKWIGDPAKVDVPTEGLMNPAYLAQRSALISKTATLTDAAPGDPPGAPKLALVPDNEVAGTTHFVVADAAGDVATMTSTVESVFGSGLVVDGYVLNNQLTDFDFVPSIGGVPSANRVEPGKRPRSSMAPTMVYGPDGKVKVAIGAAGGSTIIAQVAKALVGVLDWNMSVADAIALPQIMGMGDNVRVEEGTTLAARADELRALGHDVTVGGFPLKANGLEMVAGGWRGGADPRSEGVVVTISPAELPGRTATGAAAKTAP